MRNSYIELLSHKVEIPIIQRDYAQGRTDNKTNKIRRDFLDVLFDFIRQKHTQSPSSEKELDFIYGFNEQDSTNQTTFIPIDGQQRLTTLWLLYWFTSVKENVSNNEKTFLYNFLYETRHSTTEFCKRLIQFKPDFSNVEISAEIKNQAWYFDTWDYDPSIQAMLIVLTDIQARYDQLNIVPIWSVIGGSNCPFYFYKLDMNKVGLKDDLYIKMNSRGKALTEFEYFKASFTELLTQPEQKERFEKSIDGKWVDAVWNIIFEMKDNSFNEDIALIVDNSFLNLFNFITSVIAFKKDIKTDNYIRYKDTVVSADLLKIIFSDIDNQNFLFDTLDAICNQQMKDPLFWNNTFYYGKDEFISSKTRLFFQHKEVNLLKRCLLYFSENRGFAFPEQLLLFACFTQLKTQSKDFQNRIRSIRNLSINSENELRETIIGYSFDEIEHYIVNGDLNILKNFKTDQIEEEKNKYEFLKDTVSSLNIIRQIEDSDIFRGSISLFPLDDNFANRAKKFLELFDEDEVVFDTNTKCNLLLCFGDYSQEDKSLTNLMSSSKTVIRTFLTTPGYNKSQLYSKTQVIFLECLDYFNVNLNITPTKKIEDTLTAYISNPKDWKYYFMKYPSFREECTRGYYHWLKDKGYYCLWKMRVKQFNGYHWDPFLNQMKSSISKNLSLDNFGGKLLFSFNSKNILISTIPNGFLFENGINSSTDNVLINSLVNAGVISNNGELIVLQNIEGIDIEDRIKKLDCVLENILNNNY